MPKLRQIIQELEKLAPPYLAEKWDHIGLMVGEPEMEVGHVLCALDLNEKVVEEAIELKADCIITHHPFLFKPISSLDLSCGKGRLIKKLIVNDIAVYSMHTNFDIAWGGLNDYLAQGLGLTNIKVLSPTHETCFCKVIIYVPTEAVERVREVIIKDSHTAIGDYAGCTFSVEGEGTFIPLEGSQPFIGTTHQLTKVAEKAIGFMVEEAYTEAIIDKIRQVHPYEEMAYDIIKLENSKKIAGLGRYGDLEESLTIEEMIAKIKHYFGISSLRISTQDTSQKINKVAICSGEGSELIARASQVADLYITGDMKFHQAQMAQELGLTLVDVGHYVSENKGLIPIGDCLSKVFSSCQITYSKVNGETLFIK